MIPRSRYRDELRTAVTGLLIGRTEVTLAEIEELLPSVFARELPGRVSLSKALTAAGWTRRRSLSAGDGKHLHSRAVYCAPKAPQP